MGRVSLGKALNSEAEDDQASGTTGSTGHRALRLRSWAVTAVWVLGVIAAFACYLRLARTRAVNSDGAGQALQAWDMLHGSLLLHGWSLGDVSYYTTELPQYMLVEFLRGLNSDVVHVAAAMTYTLATLLAALLAKGDSTGRQALVRVLIAVGIMLAPQLASGVNILLSSPDHIGTSVPVMVVWLILDHARPRWYVPVIAGVFLGWAVVADMLVLYIGVLPLVVVCAIRVYRAVAVERKPLASQRYDLALAAAALAGAAAAVLALRVIHAYGGFYMPAPHAQFVQDGPALVHNLGIAAEGLLLLGGADFLGLRPSAGGAFTILHLVGVFLAAWATWLAARRFLRDRDLVPQLLVTGVAINLAVYVLSTRANVVSQTHEIAAVLPFSAALAGRLLEGPLRAAKLMPLLLVVLLGYLAGLAQEISQPPVAAQNQQLTSWLAARHLHTGLSGYWESNIVTLTSGDRVQIRLVKPYRERLIPGAYESDAGWYDPDRNTANFVVISRGVAGYPGFSSERAVLATFGKPARTYHVGSYTILVWNHNLLPELG
jgi:presenilin-like A22 family membrane protease